MRMRNCNDVVTKLEINNQAPDGKGKTTVDWRIRIGVSVQPMPQGEQV